MPLVRITLPEDFDLPTQDNISKATHQALISAFNVPQDDYFHIIEGKKKEHIRYPESYLGIKHSDQIIFIQIIAASGRSLAQKKNLYGQIADNITASTNIDRADIIITLIENAKENWSFGNGILQTFDHV